MEVICLFVYFSYDKKFRVCGFLYSCDAGSLLLTNKWVEDFILEIGASCFLTCHQRPQCGGQAVCEQNVLLYYIILEIYDI